MEAQMDEYDGEDRWGDLDQECPKFTNSAIL